MPYGEQGVSRRPAANWAGTVIRRASGRGVEIAQRSMDLPVVSRCTDRHCTNSAYVCASVISMLGRMSRRSGAVVGNARAVGLSPPPWARRAHRDRDRSTGGGPREPDASKGFDERGGPGAPVDGFREQVVIHTTVEPAQRLARVHNRDRGIDFTLRYSGPPAARGGPGHGWV